MEYWRHKLPGKWLPSVEHTPLITRCARQCVQRRSIAMAVVGAPVTKVVEPASGGRLVMAQECERVHQALEIVDDVLTVQEVTTAITADVYFDGVMVVDDSMSTRLSVPSGTYGILSFWEIPGRLDCPETVHFCAVRHCAQTGLWQPLYQEGDGFWAVMAIPHIGSNESRLCDAPSFDELIKALRGASEA